LQKFWREGTLLSPLSPPLTLPVCIYDQIFKFFIILGTGRNFRLGLEDERRPLPSERVRPAAALPLGGSREDPDLRRRPDRRRRRKEVAPSRNGPLLEEPVLKSQFEHSFSSFLFEMHQERIFKDQFTNFKFKIGIKKNFQVTLF
jgi:hypothetical protein